MKVLYITNVPSPYRVEYFNTLSSLCDLTVIYEKQTSAERNIQWRTDASTTYDAIYLNGFSINTDSTISFDVIKYLNDSYDAIIVCGISSPTQMIAIEYCKLRNLPYILEADGGFAKTGKGFKERLKKYLISGASGYFSTCKNNDEYFIRYGAKEAKIYRYPFTSVSKDDLIEAPLSMAEKKQLRTTLNMTEDRIIISVGQMIHRKGFDLLIKAASSFPNVGIYVVGGLPTSDLIDLTKLMKVSNVHFVDFKTKDRLKKYYDASDIFVLPTREDVWGLVINEAMSRALPVITTDKCNAGLEMIQQGKNGYIVPSDDVNALTNAINTILNDNIESYCDNSLKTIQMYTFEAMAQKHIDILAKYLKN